jgi:hypothetical protein
LKSIVKIIAIIVLVLAVLVVAVLINGWLWNKRVESRLLYSIQWNLSDLHPNTPPIQRKFNIDILSKLKNAGFADLIGPNLASAALIVSTNRFDNLYVFWVELSPSVDTVELKFDEQSDSLSLPISEFDIKQNKKDRRGVVFGAGYGWDKGTEIWKQMNQIPDTNNVQIRLLTSGKPETPWFKVDLYNLNRHSLTNIITSVPSHL